MQVAAPMTFAAFLAQYGATGRVKGDGYDRSMVADLTDAERERARAMLLERGLAGDTTDVAGLRLVADDATIAALREAAVLAPLRGVEWQVTRIETLFALTGDSADLHPLLTLLDIRRTREPAAQALARVALPFAFAVPLATRLGRWRYRRVALPLVIAWLQTRELDLRDPVAFQSHLPLVRRIVRALPWRRMSVLAAVARELQNATPTRDGFEWLIAPLPKEARALVRERCRYDGEPRTAAELFARLLGWMNSEGIAEGRGGYPGGRGTPGWSDYVSLQHRHLAIYHELVTAHGEAPRRIAEDFRDYERSFPPSVRLLGTGWEAVVDDVAGRLAEQVDHGFDDLRGFRLASAVAMEFLGFAHIYQLPATAQEISEARTGRAERDSSRQVQRRPHLRQHTGIDAVGLGERTGRAGELARLTRIDAGERMAARRQGSDQLAVTTAGRLEDDADIVIERIRPCGNGIWGIGDPADLSRRQIAGVNEGTRKVAANYGLWHGKALSLTVVRTGLPRIKPAIPISRIGRLMVQRATGKPSRFICRQTLRTP